MFPVFTSAALTRSASTRRIAILPANLSLALIIFLFFATLAFCQAADERRRAETLLSSPSLTERAWGVFLAGRLHDDSLDDALINKLRDARDYRDAEFGTEAHAYVAAIFDALIQSDRKVPFDLLTPFTNHWLDDVLILICRNPANNEEFFLQLRSGKLIGAQWFVVNNNLLNLHSSKFLVATLKEIQIEHTFVVVSDPSAGFGLEGMMDGASALDGTAKLPKDFPPIALYQLTDLPFNGYVLVSTGPKNVYYERTVVPTNQTVGAGAVISKPQQQDRLKYLASMTNTDADKLGAMFSVSTDIEWRSEKDFARQVKSALEKQSSAIQSFAALATQKGVQGLSGVKLTIVPKMDDHRDGTHNPLSPIAPLQILIR